MGDTRKRMTSDEKKRHSSPVTRHLPHLHATLVAAMLPQVYSGIDTPFCFAT